jgi:hypothetical protein
MFQSNVPMDYRVETPTINHNGNAIEDDDFIAPEPPPRTDYAKKALVSQTNERTRLVHC